MNAGLWLKQAIADISDLDAELLLADVVGGDRVGLRAHPERELTEVELARANKALARRIAGEPVAYITEWKEFYGRNFLVNSDVLVPRPETEVLVEVILELKPRRLLDVGTGSGVIAISAALELPETEVVAVDIAPEALEVAQKNAKRLGAVNVSFLESDLLGGLREADLGSFDVIAANLPYVDENWEWNSLELAFEPEAALYAGDGGLAVIKRLVADAPKYLRKGGFLVLEADESQHESIREFTEACGLEFAGVWGLGLVFRLS